MTQLRTVLLVALALCIPSSLALGSDFWDEVRTPGEGAYAVAVRRATIALRGRLLSETIAAANDALQLRPDDPKALVLRGIAEGERGAVQQGSAEIRNALAVDPTVLDGPFATRAASVLVRHEDFETASQVLRRVVQISPPGPARDAQFADYGDALMMLGPERIDDAIAAYQESVRANRGLPRTRLSLALALRRQGRPIEEWRPLAQDAADSQARAGLLTLPLPASELHARTAMLMELAEDVLGARSEWDLAREGHWQAFATAQSEALSSH